MSKQYRITFMGQYDVFADSKEEARAMFEEEEINQTENIWISFIERADKCNCTDCIKDGTDACPRGAGRAVDDEICDDFLEGE
ncbi:MAG: hypothetical protein J6S67_14975 [Methanobrevibacter sp.]|nr:hypothetical protein [Methanobrevibacter sp.]